MNSKLTEKLESEAKILAAIHYGFPTQQEQDFVLKVLLMGATITLLDFKARGIE
jgi:hypothetical protein